MSKYIFALIFFLGVGYFIFPRPGFISPPPNSLISNEPADTETQFRKAYFTNLSREEVLSYYKSNFKFPFLRLNHPPEDSLTLIRDQTKSSWMEELVHPLIDNLYINGFYPTKPTEQININGVHYQAKITVRYVPSSFTTQITVLLLIMVSGYLLFKEYSHV
jgi:hypothetical protein